MTDKTPVVVAFIGRRGSGKSSAAKALLNHGFVDVKFADPLKNMLRAFFYTLGLDVDETERYIEGDLKEVETELLAGRSPRHAMQTLGTEWRDLIHQELWSDILYQRIVNGSCGDKIVVSDYRFPHEEGVLHKLNATVIKIEGRGIEGDTASQHISETAMDSLSYDQIIVNDGTMLDLRTAVNEMIVGNGWATE